MTQSKTKSTKENKIETDRKYKRTVLFEYPPLPKFEIIFYFIYLICFLSWGWYRIFQVSQSYVFIRPKYYNVTTDFPIFGKRTKDISNIEWVKYKPFSLKLLPVLAIHFLVFNLSDQLLSKKYRNLWPIITTVYSFIACLWVFGLWPLLVCIGFGTLIFTITTLTRSKIAVWVATLSCLWTMLRGILSVRLSNPDHSYLYYSYLLNGYNMLCFISYNIEFLNGRTRSEDDTFFKRLFRMFYYSFYMPYLVSVIVIYPDFERQILEQPTFKRDWKKIIFFGIRLVFWYLFIDFVLHFLYFEAILHDRKLMYQVKLDALAALGYAVGQFFHLKYTIIFGIHSFFAQLDGMQPGPAPICITRVNLYSKIWRCFDRGLYTFFKEYIFLPIIRPTFSIQRKVLGVLISYSFVLLWHGIQRNCMVWIIINIASLFMETSAKGFYSIERVKTWRENNISDRNFRRILAWLQVIPYAFSLFSIFYFLGGSKTGYIFVDRYFWNEVVYIKRPFLALILLGYVHSNVCMEIERYENAKKKTKTE